MSAAHRRPGSPGGRHDARPVRVVGRGAQARRRHRRGRTGRSPRVLLRHRWLRIPIVRGVVALGESLAIGFRALAISANYAAQQEDDDGEVQTELSRGQLLFAFAIAIGFALLLFKVSPALITNWLPIESTGAFVVVEGSSA